MVYLCYLLILHGLDGPFGRVKIWSKEIKSAFYKFPDKFQLRTVRPNLMPHRSSLVFQQSDSYNCGVCCLLFVYDFLVTQVFNTWHRKMGADNTLPEEIVFGSSVYNPAVAQQVDTKVHVTKLCNMFREELVILIKRLRYLYIECKFSNSKIQHLPTWGELIKRS